ncbi:hypothetical protein VE03_10424 [Pseudogymnoascus sp. 23342-1-I1]|nr:hypothetical protein VE03_10424 [Pseudogymnoascus sp. 23342-1-I1]
MATTTEDSGLQLTCEALAHPPTTTAMTTTTTTTTTSPTESSAAPTPTDETASESTVLATTPPATSSTTAPMPSSLVISLKSTVASLSSPDPMRPSMAPELTMRLPFTTPFRPAMAVRSEPRPVVLDSPTPAHQMALQVLQSGMSEEPRRSRALTSLLALPDARHLEFRSLDPNDLPNLARVQNLEAAIAYTVGEVAQPPCTMCVRGHGHFSECVLAAGFLSGSCANCHFGGEGRRCSFRARLSTPAAEPVAEPTADSSAAPVLLSAPVSAPTTGSPSGRSGLRKRRPTWATTSCASEALTEEAPQHRKRRRRTPSPEDSRPARRLRVREPSPLPRVTAAHVRAATRAGVAPTTGLVRVPRPPLDYQLELENAVARFRVASPSSRERLRLVHSLEEVAIRIVTSSEANPGLFREDDEEDEEDGEGDEGEQA